MTGRPGARWAAEHIKPCGTNAAYKRHLAHGEVPCLPCAHAHTAYNELWAYRRGRARATEPRLGELIAVLAALFTTPPDPGGNRER